MKKAMTGQEELELIERLGAEAREKSAALRGFGGWLIFFQLRIYLGMLLSIYLLVAYRHDVLFLLAFVVSLAPAAVCLVFFYRRRMVFRAIYMAIAALGLVCASLVSIPYFLGELLAEGITVFALFSSNRVKNTFS